MISYWKNRELKLAKEVFESAEKIARKLQKYYSQAIDSIDKDICYHIGKLAENNAISLYEAKKLLNSRETAAFKMDLDEFIRKSNGEITPAVERELDLASRRVRISRLQAMELNIKKEIANLMSNEEKEVFAHLSNAFERTYYEELYGLQRITGYRHITGLSKDIVEELIKDPWTSDKVNFSGRIWGRGDKINSILQKELTHLLIRGDSPDKLMRKITNTFNTSYSNARRLISTESSAIQTRARIKSFKVMSSPKYEILATLDLKTSQICQDMDGKIFDMKDYQVGVTAPPFHPNCRSVIIPSFDDDIEREIDEETGRLARNPKTGKSERVESLKYDEWYRKYVKDDIEKEMNNKNSFVNETEDFIKSKKDKGIKVKDLMEIKIGDKKYGVDNREVVLDYSEAEKRIAIWLADKIGGNVYMCPRVLIPEEIRTPDYIWDGEKWDLKSVTQHSKNTVNNAIKNTKNQSNNVILNLIDKTYSDEDLIFEMERIYSNKRYVYIDKILIIQDYILRGIFKRA